MNSRLVLIVGVVSFLVTGFTSSFGQQIATQGQGFGQDAALSFSVASITGEPGQRVPMNISIAGAAENLHALVMIRGIPRQIKLSSGFLNGDAWLVSLLELENLRLVVPDDFEGRFDIEVIFVLVESKRRQTRSASVIIQPERLAKERLFVLEEGNQTQTRFSPVAIPSKPGPKDRLQPVKSKKALTQAKPAASPPALSTEHEKSVTTAAIGVSTAITCEGTAQVQRDGKLISTPYCQDGYLADVAQSYGVRTSSDEMRHNLSEKARVCRFIGDDNRVRAACVSYRNENAHR